MKTLLTTFLFFFTINLEAQSLNLSFNHLSREGGLSNNNVFYIYTDSRGFTWLGSLNGLNRFDGINVKVYKPYNSKIGGARISNIVEDKMGNLWIGCENGLNFYNRKKDDFELIENPTKEKNIQCYPIRFDEQGKLWLVLEGGKKKGLYVFDTQTRTHTFVTDEVVDYLGTNQGQNYSQVKTLISVGKNYTGLKKLSFEHNKLIKVESFFDGTGKLPRLQNLTDYVSIENDSIAWVTGGGSELYKFNFLKNTFKKFKANPTASLLRLTFHANYLIIGSGKGLVFFDKKTEQFVQYFTRSALNQYSLSGDWNEVPYVDRNGNLFLSQLGIGIDFTNLSRYIAEYWLKLEEVQKYGIKENEVANILSTNDYIFAQIRNGKNLVLNKNGEIIDTFYDLGLLFVDTKNRIWTTDGQYLFTYNPITKKKEKLFFKELAGKFGYQNSGTATEEGHYLFCGNFGMYEYDEKQKKLKPIIDVINKKFQNISPIFYDKHSKQVFFSANWWTDQYVLEKTNEEWKIKTKLEPQKSTYGIKASVQPNKIWFCTNNGLQLLDTKTFKSGIKTEKEGLPDNFVTDIFEESNGNYWLVTNKGISFFNKSKNEFQQFTSKDGAYSPEYDWGSAFKLSTGKVVFGGKNGITVFDDKALNQTFLVPKVQITELLVNEKPFRTPIHISEATEIAFQPSENNFSMTMAGIEYGSPEKVKIQYQLKGFDNQWITTKNPATARYANLPEGSYKFMVKALDENEKVSSGIREITITIFAPFYRTAWFRILLLLTLFAIGYALYRYRINQLLKLQAVRNRISTDLHDEIGATLSGIGILSTVAQQQMESQHPAHSLLGRITEDALMVGNSIDDIVWSINPKNDDLANVIARMNRQAAELFDAKHIDYKIVTPDRLDEIKLSMEQRRDVYLIFKEAINNLVKYANCQYVEIEIKVENRLFTLLIKDNGNGFEVAQPSQRNGIKNMKNRAKNLKGELEITSEINIGTSVFLVFRL